MITPATSSRHNGLSAVEPSERIYVGIDIGYRERVAAGIPLSGFNVARHQDHWKRAKTLHLSRDAGGFKCLRRYLAKFSTKPIDFLFLLEPTGGYYALTLLSYLIGEGYPLLQVENKAVKDYREKIFGSETKTDDTDARLTLARRRRAAQVLVWPATRSSSIKKSPGAPTSRSRSRRSRSPS